MSRKIPVVKYTNYWLEILFFIILYFLIITSLYLIKISLFFWLMPIIVASWKLFSYLLIFPCAVKGIKLTKKGEYTEAIPLFRESLDKIKKHPYIDKYRYILMFNATYISFTSIFYSNIINCYKALGDRDLAIKTTLEFSQAEPDSAMAYTKREEFQIEETYYKQDDNFNDLLLYKPKTFLDVTHVFIALFLLYMALINSTRPLGWSLSSLIIVGGYSFWKFGIINLALPEIKKAERKFANETDESLKLYIKCLDKINTNPYLDKFRAIIFLNINNTSFKEICLYNIIFLYSKQNNKKAKDYLIKLETECPSSNLIDICRKAVKGI